MQDTSILYIYIVSNANAIHITTKDCIEPYTTTIAHNYIANDCRIDSEETILAPLWVNPSNLLNICHYLK